MAGHGQYHGFREQLVNTVPTTKRRFDEKTIYADDWCLTEIKGVESIFKSDALPLLSNAYFKQIYHSKLGQHMLACAG
jgi:hypothetical protein